MSEIDLGKVKGDKGDQGIPGSQWYYGDKITGTTSAGTVFSDTGIANAVVNDKYLNTSTGSDSGNIYTCVLAGDAETAQWSYAGNIRGAQGIQGPQGPTGAVDDSTPIEFSAPSSVSDLQSGESISVLFGKVAKAVSSLLTGAVSGLLGLLTENRALISNADGKVAVSSVSATELGYLSGAESNLQNQLNELNNKTDIKQIYDDLLQENEDIRQYIYDKYKKPYSVRFFGVRSNISVSHNIPTNMGGFLIAYFPSTDGYMITAFFSYYKIYLSSMQNNQINDWITIN